jgi:hypothetical protein
MMTYFLWIVCQRLKEYILKTGKEPTHLLVNQKTVAEHGLTEINNTVWAIFQLKTIVTCEENWVSVAHLVDRED